MPHPLINGKPGEKQLLLGNEAIVRGALEANIGFVSCYPGTPSSEVPDTFFRLSGEGDYYFEYSTNEKVALEVGGGAALAGTPTLVTMKHVGVNVAADPLMTLAYVGTPGGLVLLSADDPGCHSSQNEQDNRYYARLASLPCFEPSSPQEAKDMFRDALRLSAIWEQPVLFRTTTRVNHARGPVVLGEIPAKKSHQLTKTNPGRFVPIPAVARARHLALIDGMEKIHREMERSPWNKISGDGEIGCIASGISRAYLHDALLDLNLTGKVKVLDLGFTYPLPEDMILKFFQGLKKVLVFEELAPILEEGLMVIAGKHGVGIEVLGKGMNLPQYGEYSTQLVKNALQNVLNIPTAAPAVAAMEPGLPQRPPNLCAGCPHRASYYAVRKVYGDDLVSSSDIGCYTLGILPPLKAADFLLCMGSSISTGSGLSRAGYSNTVAFIGDSTFFHSGITGVVNAVFNRHDILICILDNGTTAMTGHQPHPGAGMVGTKTNETKIDIASIVKGCGVEHIRTVNPFNLKASLAAVEEFRALSGVRVLIFEAPCPLHVRKTGQKTKPKIARITEECDGCRDCLTSLACPAFQVVDGSISINENQCGGCMLCLQICPKIKPADRRA